MKKIGIILIDLKNIITYFRKNPNQFFIFPYFHLQNLLDRQFVVINGMTYRNDVKNRMSFLF